MFSSSHLSFFINQISRPIYILFRSKSLEENLLTSSHTYFQHRRHMSHSLLKCMKLCILERWIYSTRSLLMHKCKHERHVSLDLSVGLVRFQNLNTIRMHTSIFFPTRWWSHFISNVAKPPVVWMRVRRGSVRTHRSIVNARSKQNED